MKTRLGFVSNSSSSSFVVIGVELNNKTGIKEALTQFYGVTAEKVAKSRETSVEELEDYDWYDYYYEEHHENKPGSFVFIDECGDSDVFGYLIFDSGSEDNSMPDFSVTSSKINEVAKKMSVKFGIDPSTVKVIGGTRSC